MSDKFIIRVVRRTSSSRVLHPARKNEDREHHLGPGPEHDAPPTHDPKAEQPFRGDVSDRKRPVVRLVFVPPEPEDGRDGQWVFRQRGRLGTGIDFSAENDESA
jgi:hypothetical protein